MCAHAVSDGSPNSRAFDWTHRGTHIDAYARANDRTDADASRYDEHADARTDWNALIDAFKRTHAASLGRAHFRPDANYGSAHHWSYNLTDTAAVVWADVGYFSTDIWANAFPF
jgi:hypothetical protein